MSAVREPPFLTDLYDSQDISSELLKAHRNLDSTVKKLYHLYLSCMSNSSTNIKYVEIDKEVTPMPPAAVKTVRELIFYQYAKIVSDSTGLGKKNYGMIMSTYKKLCNGDMSWSSSVREWVKEREQGDICIYCGTADKLTTDHILPTSCGGEDVPDNVVSVCKSCNSSKGSKGLYEWRGLDSKDKHHRIAEGKYLKYLYSLHEKQNTLDVDFDDLCKICALPRKCIKEGHERKLTVYCIEGCFLSKLTCVGLV